MHKRIGATILRGLKKSIKTLVLILRIIVPVSLVVILINNSPLITYISVFMRPLMVHIGLSGEAALPLFLGMFSGIAECAGAIIALGLPVKEITIIAVMVGLCNALIGETLVYRKISKYYWRTAVIRFVVAIFTGFILKFVI